MDERMEDLVVAELLRGATPEQRRQMEAQRDECRARQKELPLQVARDRAQMRSLKKYTDLIGVDVSGYTDAQKDQYERQLERLSREVFGKDR
ncbi:hypothetical protein BRADI_4g39057v3 [Brachypodium distachyon]|uniref:Uncharacterized protein n=1 Tax=Brachypodium distachyon TaxID=15368 RepID=A0A2K2CT70_BRADI|nr:hypothetical protein BRADI_4g39057v3 [Brachypodium distachyon]